MELLVIFLCSVIGHVAGRVAREEVWNEDLKLSKDVTQSVLRAPFPVLRAPFPVLRAPLHDSKLTVNPGQSFPGGGIDRRRGISASTLTRSKDAESGGMKTLESSSPLLKPLSATSNPSNKNSSRLFLGSLAKHFGILRNLTYHNIKSNFLDNFRKVTKSAGYKETNHAEKARKPLRKNNPIYTESWTALYKRLPHDLRIAIMATNYSELAFLREAVTAHDRITLDRILTDYNQNKHNELEILRILIQTALTEGADLKANSEALRNGNSWKRYSEDLLSFFRTPSALLTEYENFKKGEADIDVYLNKTDGKPITQVAERSRAEESDGAKANGRKAAKVQETVKLRVQEAGNSRAHEADRHVTAKGHRIQIRSVDNSKTLMESNSAMQYLLSRLPDVLKSKILFTDEAERKLLEYYANSQTVPNEVLVAYNSAKKDERALLKRVIKEAESYGQRILQAYKLVRKGRAWNYIKFDDRFKVYFQQPSAALAEYEALKTDESESLDAFISQPSQKERDEIEELYRKARAKAAKNARTQNDEKLEEMEREARAHRTEEIRGNEKAANREHSADNGATMENVTTANDAFRSPDDVTSADTTNYKNIGNARTRDSRTFVGIAALLLVSTIPAVAVLLIGFYRKEIKEWCRRKKMAMSASADGEKEPLNPRSKISAA